MIRVTKLVGESFDLETRKGVPKSIVLSNGFRECSFPIDDEVVRAILEMMAEEEATLPKTPQKPQASMKPQGGPVLKPQVKAARPSPVAPPQEPQEMTMATIGEPTEVDTSAEDNSAFEPGEEYNDPATGAASL